MLNVAATRADLSRARALLGGSIGLVPTMGALHDGHLSLIRAARAAHDHVIASIFVNPTQFGPNEDLSAYPRTLERDLEMLEREGVDLVFTPRPDDIYPAGFQTYVEVTDVTQGLEGARRPSHFRGVATVVTKLFNLTRPTQAFFGQKDAQQVVVLRRMVADLNQPLDIVVIPTLREADGLAMSSRNRYLSPEQRADAPVLYRALHAANAAYEAGERHPDALRDVMSATLHTQTAGVPDYVSIADPQTLAERAAPADTPVIASLTVRFGTTRLLDNMLLPFALNDSAGLTAVLGAV